MSWKNSDDYNNGKDPDYSRKESNSSSNPTIGEVQNNGGCFNKRIYDAYARKV